MQCISTASIGYGLLTVCRECVLIAGEISVFLWRGLETGEIYYAV